MSELRTMPHLRGRILLAAASGGGGHRVSVFGRTDQRRSALTTCKSGLAQFASFRLLQPGLVRPPLQLPFVPPSVMNRCPHLVWSFEHFTFTAFARFHVFTRRILGHVPRLTPPAIDQQSSHRSSRGGPPGFAPARCLRTHAIRGMTTKATRQARQVEA